MKTWFTVLALISSGLPMTPGQALVSGCASESPGEPLALCETNFFMTASPASVRVVVPRDSFLVPRSFPPGKNSPQRGLLVGALIEGEDGIGFAANIHHSISGNIPDESYGNFVKEGSYPLIPAGEYTLHLIVEAGVLDHFTFYLDGLEGTRTVTASGPTDLVLKELDNHEDLDVASSRNLYSSGAATRWDRRKFAYQSYGVAGIIVDLETQTCLHRHAPNPEKGAYGLACDGDTVGIGFAAVSGVRTGIFMPEPYRAPNQGDRSTAAGLWWGLAGRGGGGGLYMEIGLDGPAWDEETGANAPDYSVTPDTRTRFVL